MALSRGVNELTWCMPKNSAIARIIPVYHGRIVRVVNIKKRNSVGMQKMTIFVFLCGE